MKSLLFIALLSSIASFADDATKLDEHKQKILDELSKRSQLIETEKSCISAAKEHNDIKKCRDEAKAANDKLQQERREERKTQIDQQIKKLEEEKNKLSTKPAK